MTSTLTRASARRPRSSQTLVGIVLLLITAACWAYLFLLRSRMGDSASMGDMGTMAGAGSNDSVLAMPMTSAWTLADTILMWTMWAVMMAAMMIPSATPMIQAYRKTLTSPTPTGVTSSLTGSLPLFVVGYLLLWSGFGAAATAGQRLLHDATLVDAMGASTSRWVAGPVLIVAGVYQFTPLKEACLGTCRTPLGFLLSEWRSGRSGAVLMGLHHGSLCLGCCWALMALLFVLGVMNLWWIALVASVVLIEKLTRSAALPKVLGATLIGWGVLVISSVITTGTAS
ncbi:MAG: DUF2182 domain-containing protein [Acidimicrobiales bacterium]